MHENRVENEIFQSGFPRIPDKRAGITKNCPDFFSNQTM